MSRYLPFLPAHRYSFPYLLLGSGCSPLDDTLILSSLNYLPEITLRHRSTSRSLLRSTNTSAPSQVPQPPATPREHSTYSDMDVVEDGQVSGVVSLASGLANRKVCLATSAAVRILLTPQHTFRWHLQCTGKAASDFLIVFLHQSQSVILIFVPDTAYGNPVTTMATTAYA